MPFLSSPPSFYAFGHALGALAAADANLRAGAAVPNRNAAQWRSGVPGKGGKNKKGERSMKFSSEGSHARTKKRYARVVADRPQDGLSKRRHIDPGVCQQPSTNNS
jgi:hypothetical protein